MFRGIYLLDERFLMGRHKKYATAEQQHAAKQKDDRLYYERHRSKIKRKRMQRYWTNYGMESKINSR